MPFFFLTWSKVLTLIQVKTMWKKRKRSAEFLLLLTEKFRSVWPKAPKLTITDKIFLEMCLQGRGRSVIISGISHAIHSFLFTTLWMIISGMVWGFITNHVNRFLDHFTSRKYVFIADLQFQWQRSSEFDHGFSVKFQTQIQDSNLTFVLYVKSCVFMLEHVLLGYCVDIKLQI